MISDALRSWYLNLDGNAEIGAYVWIEIRGLISVKHLLRSTTDGKGLEEQNDEYKYFCIEPTFLGSFLTAQQFQLISLPVCR